MVDVVLNRASLEPLYPADDRQASADLEELLRGIACLDEVVLRSHEDLWLVPLVASADGKNAKSFAEIVHSFYWNEQRRDVAAFFDELLRMAPADYGLSDEHVSLFLDCKIGGPARGLEQTFGAVEAAGIYAVQCALTDGVLASLCRESKWQCDEMGFIDTRIGSVFNFDHISTQVHGLSVAKRHRCAKPLTPGNFWDLKQERYPNLRFGQDVKSQIASFSANLLKLAFKRLKSLDQLSAKIADNQVSLTRDEKDRYGIKPETPDTMKKYGAQRRFRDANNELKTFEEHVWVDKLYRICIFVHEEAPIIEIGYMGRHLPTLKYPT